MTSERDLADVARVALAWLTSEARRAQTSKADAESLADRAVAAVLRASRSVHMTADEAGTLLGYADEAHRDARETLRLAAHSLMSANLDDEELESTFDRVRLAVTAAATTRAVRLALRDLNCGALGRRPLSLCSHRGTRGGALERPHEEQDPTIWPSSIRLSSSPASPLP